MENSYWICQASLIVELKKRAITTSNLPHKNLHYALSLDGSKAIVQGDFDLKCIDWLKKQANTQKIGNYINGFADSGVEQYKSANKSNWERIEIENFQIEP